MFEMVKIVFECKILVFLIVDLLVIKVLLVGVCEFVKYCWIVVFVVEVGLIELLLIVCQKGGSYFFFDGYMWLDVLWFFGVIEVFCVVVDDDEFFIYNKWVNWLVMIQEYYMIVCVFDCGVLEEKLVCVFNVDVKVICQCWYFLVGISVDVVELLKDKLVGYYVFQKLCKMKLICQFEVVELMVLVNNYMVSYVKVFLVILKLLDLYKFDEFKKVMGLLVEQMGCFEWEMVFVSEDYKEFEVFYGDDMLVLVVVFGFIECLLVKFEIEGFLVGWYFEFLENFCVIVQVILFD